MLNGTITTSPYACIPLKNSVTTSTDRRRLCRTLVPERPLASFSVDTRSGFDVFSAGSRPNTRPVTMDKAIVNAATKNVERCWMRP